MLSSIFTSFKTAGQLVIGFGLLVAAFSFYGSSKDLATGMACAGVFLFGSGMIFLIRGNPEEKSNNARQKRQNDDEDEGVDWTDPTDVGLALFDKIRGRPVGTTPNLTDPVDAAEFGWEKFREYRQEFKAKAEALEASFNADDALARYRAKQEAGLIAPSPQTQPINAKPEAIALARPGFGRKPV